MNYNYATHATCPLSLIMYKYNELQVSSVIQKLSCKANCKTPLFLIMEKYKETNRGRYIFFGHLL